MYGMPRLLVDVVDEPLLHQPAGVHHHHTVGHPGDHAEVVGDQDDRRVERLAHTAERLEHLRLHGHVEGGRRLVGDDQLWVVDDRHGDHRPLAHAAGELVWVAVEAGAGLGDADEVEHLDGALLGHRHRDLVVSANGLGELVADGVHRVQRRHRILEDHGDALAPDVASDLVAKADQLLAVEPGRAGDPRRLRQQPEQRHRRHRLARSGLADDAEDLALVQVEADAAHGLDETVIGREPDGEVLDDEHRLAARRIGHWRTLVWRGSKASRRPSPMKLMVSAMATMNRPGHQNSHGRVVKAFW